MKYQNGKIYSIRSYQTDKIYIGSTTQPLSKRLYKHKINFKNYNKGKYCYTTSYEIVKHDDCYVELLELCPCTCKEELLKREGELIREKKNCVNKIIPGRTDKEYYDDNKEKYKQYRLDNKEKTKIYDKQYRIDNEEKIKERYKVYYDTNKEKIKERKKLKITCECGSLVRKSDIRKHERSDKHFDFMNIYVV